MGRERTCRFLRHGRRDYVAQRAPSARSGSGMYSQQLEQNQYASLICTKPKHPPAPKRKPRRNPTPSFLPPLSSYRRVREFLPELLDRRFALNG